MIPAVSEEVKDALVKNIRRRMTPQPLKIRADVEMKCFQFDGVLHIKVLFCAWPELHCLTEINFLSLQSSEILMTCLAFAGCHEKS